MNKLPTSSNDQHCISVKEAREILGEKMKHLTDEQILQLITELEQLSDIFIKSE
ncbi:hypothetical protein JW766_04655 [Candidatus Dojkabacteria bacterium]|nr:hypothetical protein [Candidatus Dojkabacteria bacterium]